MLVQSVTLYYRQGNSDKIYQTSLEEKGGGFVVNFAYGRRGSTLRTETKTPSPILREKAESVFNKLVNSKTAKGYTPGEDGTPYVHTDKAKRDSGVYPQLLNPIEDSEANLLLSNSLFWMQEKHDGQRLLIRKSGESVEGINRKGLTRALPKPVLDHAKDLGQRSAGNFIIDGEVIGDKMFAFDAIGVGVRGSYSHRLRILERWVNTDGAISVVKTARTTQEKSAMMAALKKANAEGVVFKDKSAYYAPGRPASGGPQLKFKFYETASLIVVAGRAGKRSVALELVSGKTRIGAGNVTIPANRDIPKPGAIVEVRYLYAYRESGRLYQPVYLGERDDVGAEDCTTAQLKYRAADDEDES